jgi:pyridoxal phosphate enzyme (YggS family)
MGKCICESIEHIRDAINSIKHVSDSVELMAVTKNFSFQDVLEALKCGIRHIGESRIQEALPKFKQLGGFLGGITKHFIGRLQSNKVRHVVENFDLIHSLDNVKLADVISRYSGRIGKVQGCLIEVKVSREPSKTGVGLNDVKCFYKRLLSVPNVSIRGLMAIAPCGDTPEDSRVYFKRMYDLFECIRTSSPSGSKFDILSMGMSDDYKVAVEEGATMLRIGSAIFGRRDPLNI